jgi:hypothetical protein
MDQLFELGVFEAEFQQNYDLVCRTYNLLEAQDFAI